jgi:CheY-like chemotaxis protein
VTKDESLILTADALETLRRYLAFIETRAESLGHRDAEPADRARDLDDVKGAVAAARALLSGTPAAVVLVVDDHVAIHQLARRILEPEGYQVVSAADAPAALLALSSTAADVVLCDVHMPGRDGLWLAERIRDAHPTTAVVFATADPTLQPTQTLRKGIVGYVLKPFRHDLLLQAVREGIRWASDQRKSTSRAAGPAGTSTRRSSVFPSSTNDTV